MILGPDKFVGRWALSRRIEDRLTKQEGLFSGEARFDAESATRLRYSEDGELRLGRGQAFRAQRVYFWTFEASEVVVTFDDGRDFHHFVPEGAVDGSDHPCGDDYYTVAYDFNRWPMWRATWTVLGPRKDYTSVSTYMKP